MTVLNELDRFHLAQAVFERVPRLAPRLPQLRERVRAKLAEHREYIRQHGEDMPEIRGWKWTPVRTRPAN
jgi:xylulose-5-phosphate/fructose-6-phosphate phosphoketolase